MLQVCATACFCLLEHRHLVSSLIFGKIRWRLNKRNFRNKTVAFVENGSWAPMATKVMRGMLEKCKNITYTEASVKITSALNEQSRAQLCALAEELK